MVSVYSMTIVIRSVYSTCLDRFYPQIYLKNCIYKTCRVVFRVLLSNKIVRKGWVKQFKILNYFKLS